MGISFSDGGEHLGTVSFVIDAHFLMTGTRHVEKDSLKSVDSGKATI